MGIPGQGVLQIEWSVGSSREALQKRELRELLLGAPCCCWAAPGCLLHQPLPLCRSLDLGGFVCTSSGRMSPNSSGLVQGYFFCGAFSDHWVCLIPSSRSLSTVLSKYLAHTNPFYFSYFSLLPLLAWEDRDCFLFTFMSPDPNIRCVMTLVRAFIELFIKWMATLLLLWLARLAAAEVASQSRLSHVVTFFSRDWVDDYGIRMWEGGAQLGTSVPKQISKRAFWSPRPPLGCELLIGSDLALP